MKLHDRDQTENQQNAATVDGCFELVGSRQQGVAQQKVEQPTRGQSTKISDSAQIQTFVGPHNDE